MEDEGKADKGQIEQLRKIQELKRQFDEEMPEALSTGKLDRAWGLKAEIERRINAVQEILTPPGTFNKEQKEALENRGYVIHRLTGESIKSLEDKGYNFATIWYKNYFENKTSRLTEIAFNPHPDKFLLPLSNYKTLEQQKWMVDDYSEELQQEITGVKAVIGEAPDYVELAFHYTGKFGPLFGEEYGNYYTRTKTTVGSDVVGVGDFNPFIGLAVSGWRSVDLHEMLWVAPLIVSENS